MKKLYVPIVFLCIVSAACKKKMDIPAGLMMTVSKDGDSTWSTSHVTSEISNGVLYIKGTSANGANWVTLGINHYQAGNHSYTILNTGIGINVNESNAQYEYGPYITVAVTGRITTTGGGGNTIGGTFDFQNAGPHITGTFVAPTP